MTCPGGPPAGTGRSCDAKNIAPERDLRPCRWKPALATVEER
jgi:hypothetical protein